MLNALQNIRNLDPKNLHASVRQWAPRPGLFIYFLLLADYLQTLHVLWLTISVVLCALIDCDCDMDHESAA